MAQSSNREKKLSKEGKNYTNRLFMLFVLIAARLIHAALVPQSIIVNNKILLLIYCILPAASFLT